MRAPSQTLEALLAFADHDPSNGALLEDALTAAMDAGQLDVADKTLERLLALGPLSPSARNVAGLSALRKGRFKEAATVFEGLLEAAPGDPALRANLAWAKAGDGAFADALPLLDDHLVAAQPSLAILRLRGLHAAGRLEEALDWAAAWVDAADAEFLGAAAQAALDFGDETLALRYAERSADTHEGAAVLGLLALEHGELGSAQAQFQRALAIYPASARASLGQGLALLASGRSAEGAVALEKAAQTYSTHLGSWIAAGWAQFTAGDLRASRATFEHALAIDDTFAETHGALAVLDALEGLIQSARRRIDIAMRLDKKSFSAALASTILLEAEGRADLADRVRDRALSTVIGPRGQTLQQMITVLAKNGLGGRRP